MADLYFGYAERNASDEINWSAIGKSVTDMLKNETDIREQKKAAIDKASREFGETLANAPQGEHQGINQWALTYADSAQKARLMQDRLLKSGQLKPKDYFVMRQNINDGTKQAFNLIKEYQAEYKDKMDRYQKGESQALEQWLMAEAEGFGNFNDSELYINPTNFEVNIAKKKKEIVDGKEVYVMSKDPNDFTTVNAMRNRIKGRFNKIDVAKTLQGGVDVLGKDIVTLVDKIATTKGGGLLKTTKDIVQRPDFGVETNNAISLFERAENTYLDSIMAIPDNVSSILTDYANIDPKTKQAYTYTWDASKAGGNVILLKNDSSGRPVPQFTDEQKEVAKSALRTKFRTMLDREIELRPTPQVQAQYAPPYVYEGIKESKEQDNALNLWEQLYTATTTGGKEAAKQGLLGSPLALKQGLVDIDVSDGQNIKLIYSDASKNREFKVADEQGNPLVSPEQWASFGTEFHGITDPKRFSKFSGQQFGTSGVEWDKISGGRAGSNTPGQMYNQFISSSISTVPTDEETAVKELSPILSKIGFKVESPFDPTGEYIIIKNKDGVRSKKIDIEDANAIKEIQGFLLGNVPGEDEKEKYAYLYNLMKSNVFGQQGKPKPSPTPKEIKDRINRY